jgi:thiamine pyrophosphokinase
LTKWLKDDFAPKVWLFLNGPIALEDLPKTPPAQSPVLAADGGAKALIRLNWPVNLIVGDLDSLSEKELSQVPKAADFRLLTFPRNKDETDFELLFPRALKLLAPNSLLAVAGALGGRWDMTLANLLLPFAARFRRKWRSAQVVFLGERERIYALQGPTELTIPGRKTFSLLPAIGTAGPLSIRGDVAYPLENGSLAFGRTRGLSNETGPKGGELSLDKGFLLVAVAPLEGQGG